MNLRDSAAKGGLEALRALRDVTAESIEAVEAHLRAPLIRQLSLILAEIEGLEPAVVEQKGSVFDDLAARRAARAARAKGSASP